MQPFFHHRCFGVQHRFAKLTNIREAKCFLEVRLIRAAHDQHGSGEFVLSLVSWLYCTSMYVRKDCSVNKSIILYYTHKHASMCVRIHIDICIYACVRGWVRGSVCSCVRAYGCVRAKTGWGIAHPNSMYVRKHCSVRTSTCAYVYTKIHASIYGCHTYVHGCHTHV